MKNNFNKEELCTIYFALTNKLYEEKEQFEKEESNKIEAANRIDYLKHLINKVDTLINK
jgi:hypothetical protein